MSKNKSIKDSQINYLINLLKTNYIESVSITNNIVSITKNGQTTTYDLSIADVTDTKSGLMTPDYKNKLDNIQAGAEVNQNAFAAIKFNEMAIMADTTSDIMHITSGENVIFDVNADGDAIEIRAKDTTYNIASESEAGLMSSDDRVKLKNIEDGANKTIVDNSLSDTSENPVQNKVIKTELNSIQEAIPIVGYISNDIIDSICGGTVYSASEVLF